MLSVLSCCGVFFFFKQKTAYEMRISDWSSDVCSSDLPRARSARASRRNSRPPRGPSPACPECPTRRRGCNISCRPSTAARAHRRLSRSPKAGRRSEEHTSELQSLMRISYAVFCLKKKNNYPNYDISRTTQQKSRTTNYTINNKQ